MSHPATDSLPLEGRGAVITGGGRGIGAAVARDLARVGARIVVSARSQDQIDEIAGELRDSGAEAWAVPCDVSDPDAVSNLRSAAEKHLGTVDILINNAGVAQAAPLKATSLEDWNRIFAVNMTGTFLCTQAFLPGMVEQGWGRVVNVASIAGKMGAPYISAYSASKHAVIGFTRSIGEEVATTGVTVNAVCPGYVETEMTTQSVENIVDKTKLDEEGARQSLEAMSPQRRIFEAEEVSYQVLCLCHPRARGVNAQAVVLDGGRVQS